MSLSLLARSIKDSDGVIEVSVFVYRCKRQLLFEYYLNIYCFRLIRCDVVQGRERHLQGMKTISKQKIIRNKKVAGVYFGWVVSNS